MVTLKELGIELGTDCVNDNSCKDVVSSKRDLTFNDVEQTECCVFKIQLQFIWVSL